MTGRLDGTAKYFYTSGAVETRIYENGVLQGKAVKQSSSGEVEERNYVDGKLNGKATVLYQDTSKEMRTYKVSFYPLFTNHFSPLRTTSSLARLPYFLPLERGSSLNTVTEWFTVRPR